MTTSYPPQENTTPSLWLVSFADLTAILVAFFVLIYAMSLPVPQMRDGRVSGTQSAVAGGGQIAEAGQGQVGRSGSVRPERLSADLTLGYLSAVLADRHLAARSETGPVMQSMDARRGLLLVDFEMSFLFDPRSGDLRPLARTVLSDIAVLLNRTNNSVRLLVPVGRDGWTRAFDQADMLHAGFRQGGYGLAVDRMVSPAAKPGFVQLLIGQGEGA